MKVRCQYAKGVEHEYPDDWVFGGADKTHPAADPRYQPQVYLYFDTQLAVAWRTSMMTCDEMAVAFRRTCEMQYHCTVQAIQRVVPDGKPVTLYMRPS